MHEKLSYRLLKPFLPQREPCLEERLPGAELLVTHQRMLTEARSEIAHRQILVKGAPADLKLNDDYRHFICYSEGRTSRGKGLEKSIFYHEPGKPAFFIFDSDHLTYPYAVWALKHGLVRAPFDYLQVDGHIDWCPVGKKAPSASKSLDKHLKYFSRFLREYNFVPALADSGCLNAIHLVSEERLSENFFRGYPRKRIEAVPSKVYESDSQFPAGIFLSHQPRFLGIDLDFFSHRSLNNHSSPQEQAEEFVNKLRAAGYSPCRVQVIAIATSPGYNEGYQNEEEAIGIAKYLIEKLSNN